MNKRILLSAALTLALPLPALASEALANEKQCLQCHKVREDWAGPSFQRISQKWKGRKNAEKQLTAAIQNGSKAMNGPHWGVARMPDGSERPPVSNAEAKELIAWIRSQ